MARFFLFLFFNLLFFVVASKGQTQDDTHERVSIRQFDKDALNAFKADKDFRYGDLGGDISKSWWESFWESFWDLFEDNISNASSNSIFKYVFIALGCVALIFLLLKLSGMDSAYLFSGRSKQIDLPFQENLENIHEISFDESIDKALQNHDYRLAVRLLYLKSLKRLNDTGRIIWKPEKTNSAYVDELKIASQKQKFRALTHRFEYVWYGSFPVDREAYARISQSFLEFHSS